ncbi:glycoside hydrolase family 61 protein [Ceratobasidium sp. AG-Ba]|nr:glycoside hydrolase family 61 protein [Ceratobasidium sp. AG-Ba]
MRSSAVLCALACAGTALAHVRLTAISVNGGSFATNSVRLPPNNSPVTDVTSNNIICNVNGSVPASGVTTVPAGATVTVQWDQGAHPGPNLIYLAKVSDAKTSTITGLKWFKISQEGLISGSTWSSPKSDGKYTFKVPSNIAPGAYLLRGETIGLHVASTYPGAQFYMSCVQINVTGGGSASPTGVSFPGAYKGSDPGITINIYNPPPTSYTFPGPSVYSG